MEGRRIVAIGAALGAIGVLLGAFGAHAMEGRLDAKALSWWHTATLYHLVHAPGIVGAGLLHDRIGRGAAAGVALAIGIVLFSGTLYAMALGAPRVLGAITPLGGTAMIVGWTLLAVAAGRRSASATTA